MKNRVAIIDSVGAHGSSFHFYVFGQAKGLISSGVKISVYTNDETKNPDIESLNFFQPYKRLYNSRFKIISGLRYIQGSIFAIFHARFTGCRILHFHLFHSNILMLFNILLTRLLFGKAALTIHDANSFSENREYSVLSKLIYRFANTVITHNLFSKNEIEKNQGLDSSDINIIPHGNYLPFINIQKSKSMCRSRLQIPNNKKVVLFFGMIKKSKGLEVLLNALKKVKAKHDDVLLLIAGKCFKNDFNSYQKIIDNNNLSDHCMLHIRYIPDEDVEYYYGAADLVALPYTRIYQSGVLLMSLSFKKPTLISDLTPLTDIITHNQTGFVFKSQNSCDLAEKLNSILEDRDLLNQISDNAFELIKTKYSWQEIGINTKKIYQRLIE